VRWRKRILVGVAIAIIAALGFGLGALLEGGRTSSDMAALEVAGSTEAPRLDLSWCKSHAARRLQLFVGGISCADALRVVPRFSGHVSISYLRGVNPLLFPDHGWTCWAKPNFSGSGIRVQNFCLRDGEAIVYLKRS
jgi:hypothetical protein